MGYKEGYLQVDHDFITSLKEMKAGKKHGKVHFFNYRGQLDDAVGDVPGINRNDNGEFIEVDGKMIRLDKIITILGKPGPAYEEYDRYANACLTCEDLDQF